MKPSASYKFIICLAAIVSGPVANSQNMNSPYSVYGIGDIDNKMYNRTTGMGGTGLALKSSTYLIDNNPAGLTGLPRSFFMANVSVAAKASTYSGDPIDASNSKNKDMWVKRLALAIKINSFWAGSIGFGQFSNVNYRLSGNQFIEGGSSTYKTAFEGEGGLNEYYWTNAVAIGKHWSLGIKSSVIAGSINQVETLSDEILQSTMSTQQQDYIGDIRFQAGILYEKALNKKWDFAIGARYAPQKRFSSQRTVTITENDESLFEDEYIKSDRFYLPQSLAAGIVLKYDKKTSFAADYIYEDWTSLHIKEPGWQLTSSHRISAGLEFSKFKKRSGQTIGERFYQVGGYFNQSYLQIRNTPIREYGFTTGIGGAIGNNLLYSLSAEVGVRGTTTAKLIKETYCGLTLNLNYSEFLFSKGRKYD